MRALPLFSPGNTAPLARRVIACVLFVLLLGVESFAAQPEWSDGDHVELRSFGIPDLSPDADGEDDDPEAAVSTVRPTSRPLRPLFAARIPSLSHSPGVPSRKARAPPFPG